MQSRKLALLCRDLAENKKAENTVILDVRKFSSITDYFVITSGGTEPHLRAIVNEITDRLHDDHDVTPRAIDGDRSAAWQVMDFFDVIVHVMRTDVREKYDLEGLWGDASQVGRERAKEPKPRSKSKAGTSARKKRAGKTQGKTASPPEIYI
jgi:ribosome-associated protein